MELSDERCFTRALAAFAGERYRLDAGASKVMYFMCHDPSGCDAVITPSSFEINYGWNYGPHRYFLQTAPGIVSWLLIASGACGEREVRAPIGPTTIPTIDGYPGWQMPALHVAMLEGPAQIAIRVRDTIAGLADPLPSPIVGPPFLELPHLCRHCGRVPERYRVLRDGSLVCLACGRSQPRFESPAG